MNIALNRTLISKKTLVLITYMKLKISKDSSKPGGTN